MLSWAYTISICVLFKTVNLWFVVNEGKEGVVALLYSLGL